MAQWPNLRVPSHGMSKEREQVKAPPRCSQVAPLIASAALLTVVVAATACGSSPSPATTATKVSGSTLAIFQAGTTKTYTSQQDGYTFLYPKNWAVADQTSVDATAGGSAVSQTGIADPAGAEAGGQKIDVAIIGVYKLTATISAVMMPQARKEVESVLSSIESQASGIKTLEALSQISINGMAGFKVTYSLPKDGVPLTSTMYFLFSGNVEYQVSVQASDAHWANDKPIFDAMMASFKPGPSK